MMIRRVQATGGASLSVTLPKRWVVRNKLRAKDKVIIDDLNGWILIKPDGSKAKKKIYKSVINTSLMTPNRLSWELEACYVSGVDEVEIVNSQVLPEQMRLIRGVIANLLGFEIVEVSFDRVVIKNIYDHDRLPLKQAMQQLLVMTKRMFEEVIECMLAGNKTGAKELIERDDEVDKLYKMIFRQSVLVMGQEDPELSGKMGIAEAQYYRNIAMCMERIADHAANLAKFLLQEEEISDWIGDEVPMRVIMELRKQLEAEIEMVMNTDKLVAYEVMEQCDKLEQRIGTLGLSKYRRKPHFSLVVSSLGRVRSYLMNTAEYTVDYVVWEQVGRGGFDKRTKNK